MNLLPASPALRRVACSLALSICGAFGTSPLRAQSADPATVTQLLRRIEALEQEVRALKAAPTPAAPSAIAPAAPVAAPEPAVVDTPEHYPKVEFHLLGDVTYSHTNDRNEADGFMLGDLDPVVTAKFTERSGALGDFVIATNHGNVSLEIERFLLQYHVNDLLNFEVGRFHTMIGYYNNTFHNGTFFQTTVDRPAIFDFEDSGGILPIHSDGVSVKGELPLPSLGLHYVAEIANGRDYTPKANFNEISDNNNSKAVNLALFARPEALPGAQFGVSAYRDSLTTGELPRADQWIFSAHAVYRTRDFEWINEGLLLQHKLDHHTYRTSNFYTQLSRKFGAFRPYVRLEWRHTDAADPIIAPLEQNQSFQTRTIGVRYDFAPMMAFKLEFERNAIRDGRDTVAEVAQFTFRF